MAASSTSDSATWFKNVQIPTEPTPTALLVTHISPAATEEKIREFFSFCGSVTQLELIPWTDPTTSVKSQRAFVQFQFPEAAHTAVLLNNATIVDMSINIAPYFDASLLPKPAAKDEDESVTMVNSMPLFGDHEDAISQEDKPKQSIVADLIAKGYRLGDKIMADAEEFDNKHGFSVRFSQFFDRVKARGGTFSERYQLVSGRARDTANAFFDDVRTVNEKYHVTGSLNEFVTATGNAAADMAKRMDETWKIRENVGGAAAAAVSFFEGVVGGGAAAQEQQEDQQQEEKQEEKQEEVKDEVKQ